MLVACSVYLVGLGSAGFHSTEGHRVIPAWEMLRSGEYLPTRMFETAYVRKPAGMPWVIAVSASVLGESEFSARLPSALSAISLVVLSYIFAARWFGIAGALFAGLAQALSPQFWMVGRTAEIESVFLLGVFLTCAPLVDVAVRGRSAKLSIALLVSVIGSVAMVITKGPAGLPAVVGVLLASALIGRSAGAFSRVCVIGITSLAMGSAVFLSLVFMTQTSIDGERSVAQAMSEFVWNIDRVGGVAQFPFLLFAAGFPFTLALLFSWGADAHSEGITGGADSERAYAAARVLTLGWLLGTAVFMLALVENNRYGLPCQALLGPLAGYIGWGVSGGFGHLRRQIARVMMLGHPLVLCSVLLGAAVWWVAVGEQRIMPSSGKASGISLAEVLNDNDEIWADGCVEARPEALLYMQKAMENSGRRARIRWMKWNIQDGMPAAVGTVLVLRADSRRDRESEYERYVATSGVAYVELWRETVHIYEYVAIRIVAPGS